MYRNTDTKTYVNNVPILSERQSYEWYRSVRWKRRLILSAHPMSRVDWKIYSTHVWNQPMRGVRGIFTSTVYPEAELFTAGDPYPALEARSYAKFRGKLYKGSASLGVTAASYKQSREMITDRYGQLMTKAGSLEEKLFRHHRTGTRRKKVRVIADAHLEIIFGWTPLLGDIQSAARSVIQKAEPLVWLKSSAKSEPLVNREAVAFANGVCWINGTSEFRVVRAATVRVTNPNKWLSERAGLLNVGAVAWDLVPWSFVVNMFVNTGQLVNSITDFVGLEFSNGSMTKSGVVKYQLMSFETKARTKPYGLQFGHTRRKVRTANAVLRPPLVVKLPGVDWSLAAMAASLFTQKLGKIQRLLNS